MNDKNKKSGDLSTFFMHYTTTSTDLLKHLQYIEKYLFSLLFFKSLPEFTFKKMVIGISSLTSIVVIIWDNQRESILTSHYMLISTGTHPCI